MERINKYKPVLQLDNFLQVLTFEERLQVSQYRAGRTEKVPKIVLLLNDWIEENHWQPPEFKYSDNRELLYKENNIWKPIQKHELYKAKIVFKKD